MKRHITLAALCLLTAGSAFGEVVLYTFSGSVSTVYGNSFFGISVNPGDPLTGFISYDTGATSVSVSAVENMFFQTPPLAFGLTVGGLTLQSDSAFTMDVARQGTFVQTVQLWDTDYQISANGVLTNVQSFELAFTIQTPNPTLDLPVDLNAVGEITFQHGTINVLNQLGLSAITYDLDSLTIVPEPGAMGLLFTGFMGAAIFARRRGHNGARSSSSAR